VRVVAERVGVPIATLRSWNQRYGIGPAEHSPGRHRLYSEADIAVVEQMHKLISTGANPRTAARAALDWVAPARADTGALLTAAFDLDTAAAGQLLERHLQRYGVTGTWEELIRPAFETIERRKAEGEGCVDVEHALSWAVSRALQRLPAVGSGRPVSTILACCQGEAHTLPLEVLLAGLGERGLPALMLAADVPTVALADAIARTAAPTTVVLWAQTDQTADVAAARTVLAAHARLLLAGPGWKSVRIPRRATRIDSLGAALQQLTDSR
jgi:DNA-binding transcriptional MerR regulator